MKSLSQTDPDHLSLKKPEKTYLSTISKWKGELYLQSTATVSILNFIQADFFGIKNRKGIQIFARVVNAGLSVPLSLASTNLIKTALYGEVAQ